MVTAAGGLGVELLDFTPTGVTTMTEDRLPLNELLQKAGDGDFVCVLWRASCNC